LRSALEIATDANADAQISDLHIRMGLAAQATIRYHEVFLPHPQYALPLCFLLFAKSFEPMFPFAKISPRRAAVMAYTANLLLRTLPVIAKENLAESQQQGIIFDHSDWGDPGDGLWHPWSRLPSPRR
jgi:hypothetical protein